MRIEARRDERLRARVVGRWRLDYDAGPDPTLDRPGHVRAASGLTWFDGRLAVAQDDANFLAWVDPHGRSVDWLALPVGPDGGRLFDAERGNKNAKLDLEACAAGPWGEEEVLLAFGSGSRPERERIAVLRRRGSAPLEVALVPAPELYGALRAAREFSGSELNLEGATLLGGQTLRLAQRGNGAPRGGLAARDATCELGWSELLAHLLRGGPLPELRQTTEFVLGALDGVRLGFTDLCAGPGEALLYLAGAEDSPDAVQDGPVAGAALGVIDAGGARWTPLCAADGSPLREKAEGLTLDLDRTLGRAWVVVDPDQHQVAAELLEVALEGPWV